MKMTRFLSLTLALLLTLALFTTALAANQNGNPANIPLSAKIVPGGDEMNVTVNPVWFLEYDSSVDFGKVTVEAMGDVNAVWDPQKGTYTLATSGLAIEGFAEDTATLSITNKSNFDVMYNASIENPDEDDDVGSPFYIYGGGVQETLGRQGSATITVSLEWHGDSISPEGLELSGSMTIIFDKSGDVYPVD